MIINFTKMQGAGNDFILIDGEEIQGVVIEDLAVEMCNRHYGVGADGLIVVNPLNSLDGTTDTAWKFINSDGSLAEMCGNGIRCFAKYVKEKGIVQKDEFTVKTLAGIMRTKILEDGRVKVNMSAPILEPEKIPAKVKNPLEQKIKVDDKQFIFNAIGMGNPHCVIFSDEDTEFLAKEYGPKIEVSEIFPNKTNVEFVKIISPKEIKVDVWERGCGITLACGTGTCASVVAGILNGILMSRVIAHLPGGDLEIEWNGKDLKNPIYMTGEAVFVFEGKYRL